MAFPLHRHWLMSEWSVRAAITVNKPFPRVLQILAAIPASKRQCLALAYRESMDEQSEAILRLTFSHSTDRLVCSPGVVHSSRGFRAMKLTNAFYPILNSLGVLLWVLYAFYLQFLRTHRTQTNHHVVDVRLFVCLFVFLLECVCASQIIILQWCCAACYFQRATGTALWDQTVWCTAHPEQANPDYLASHLDEEPNKHTRQIIHIRNSFTSHHFCFYTCSDSLWEMHQCLPLQGWSQGWKALVYVPTQQTVVCICNRKRKQHQSQEVASWVTPYRILWCCWAWIPWLYIVTL